MWRSAWICPHLCLRQTVCFVFLLSSCYGAQQWSWRCHKQEAQQDTNTSVFRHAAANHLLPRQYQAKNESTAGLIIGNDELKSCASQHDQPAPRSLWPIKQIKLTNMKGPLVWTANPTSLHISPYQWCKHHLLILSSLEFLTPHDLLPWASRRGHSPKQWRAKRCWDAITMSTQQQSHSYKAKLFQHMKQPTSWKAAVLTACCMHHITNKHSSTWGHGWEVTLSPMKVLLVMAHRCSEARRHHAQI